MFFTLFGYWPHGGGGVSQGIGTLPAYAVFHAGQLKIKVFKTGFYDIVITQNDHARYLCFSKHVLGRIYVYFTPFGYWPHGGGGGLPRDWYTTCLCSFSPRAAQKRNLFF